MEENKLTLQIATLIYFYYFFKKTIAILNISIYNHICKRITFRTKKNSVAFLIYFIFYHRKERFH